MSAQGRGEPAGPAATAPAPGASATLPAPAALAQATVDATAALVLICDGAGRILLANPALQRFTALPEGELLGRPFWEVVVIPEETGLARAALQQHMSGGPSLPKEVDWLAAAGHRRRVELQSSVLTDDVGRAYALAFVAIDVTEQREREAVIRRQATTDSLTGVGNRSVLFEALHERLHPRTGEGCGLLFIDLDDFKAINDRYGHVVGDRVLVEVASRLSELAGRDDLIARFGGDEFVLLRPYDDAVTLAALAARMEARMRLPFDAGDDPLQVGISVGIATGRPGERADELMGRADRSMYGSKSRRRRSRSASRPRRSV